MRRMFIRFDVRMDTMETRNNALAICIVSPFYASPLKPERIGIRSSPAFNPCTLSVDRFLEGVLRVEGDGTPSTFVATETSYGSIWAGFLIWAPSV